MPPSINRSLSPLVGMTHDDTGSFPNYVQTFVDNRTFRYGKDGHYGYPNFNGKNVGGGMYLEGVTTDRSIVPVGEIWRGGPLNLSYEGSLVVDVVNTGAWNGTFLPDGWGAEAFKKMKPTKPSFNALNSIFELREFWPMLQQRFLSQGLKAIPNYWLALQFGWKPLLSDIRKAIQTQMNAQKVLAQLLRDNGRPVRRSIKILDVSTIVADEMGATYGAFKPVLITQFYKTVPRYRKKTSSMERVWASAQFRYHLPPGPRDVAWRRRMLGRIFGLNPTPSVVYNAIPWTWLFDWFTHVGDLIENLEAGVADRLAADYFYIMRQKGWTIEQSANGLFTTRDGADVKVSGTSFSEAFVKTRAKGDPFGFNTDALTLNGMQLSILGALGLSRLR